MGCSKRFRAQRAALLAPPHAASCMPRAACHALQAGALSATACHRLVGAACSWPQVAARERERLEHEESYLQMGDAPLRLMKQ